MTPAMVGSLRDPEHLNMPAANDALRDNPVAPPFPDVHEHEEEHRPPVLGILLTFIVLFWGGLLALWLLLRH